MKHADVVVIGGSLAGAACVRQLARQGIDAVAFERDRFPREKVCGGFLSPGAVELLDELEMLERVRAAGAVAVRSSHVRAGKRAVDVELPKPGLGVSRRTLDALMADHPAVQHGAVRAVKRDEKNFRIQLNDGEVTARVVVDAAGKLSRFTPRRTSPQFGVQFYEAGSRGDVLEFWFFDGGYGGIVTIEDGRSNACFLVERGKLGKGDLGTASEFCSSNSEAVPRSPFPNFLLSDCLVTGPVAYDRRPGDFIAIGDAAGMVDPFCGEGMRHALDTGMRAARTIADGLSRGLDYGTMKTRYESDAAHQWRGKRRLGTFVRTMLRHPHVFSAGFRFNPEYWFSKLWA